MSETEGAIEEAPADQLIPFAVQAERWLGQEARFVSWCPTMDLVALVFADESVWIHRLNYERLHALPKQDKTITALGWRPDGSCCSYWAHYHEFQFQLGFN